MNIEQVALMGLGLGFSVLGWFARELWNAVQRMKEELGKLEVKINSDFVRYDRMQDAMKPVLDKLQRIEDALAKKVDK
ncbi:MAG: hypothetical protein ABIR92_10320 [Gemmatimonadaceae bacterium]